MVPEAKKQAINIWKMAECVVARRSVALYSLFCDRQPAADQHHETARQHKESKENVCGYFADKECPNAQMQRSMMISKTRGTLKSSPNCSPP